MRAFLLFVSLCCLLNGVENTQSVANPIRKVVTLLQNMVKKVEHEGEKDEEMHKKFTCWCKTGGGDLEKSIAAAEKKIPELISESKEDLSKHDQLKADVKSHKSDRDAAKAAIKQATSIRNKENSEFEATHADATADIKAGRGALAALKKGTGTFLQVNGVSVVKRIIMNKHVSDVDRDDMIAFLEGGSQAPSDQIIGILSQLIDEMSADDADAVAEEKASLKEFNALVAAKNKEIAALSASIETKTTRIGELAVKVAQVKEAIDDTKDALAEDKQFLADLKKNCASNDKMFEERKKIRAEELLALSDTIKVLNDDDALDLFGKTLPKPSFMQIQVSAKSTREHALSIIKGVAKPHMALDFISLALRGKKIGFEQVIKMIDEMVQTLAEEQESDDNKKQYCGETFDSLEDTKKELEHKGGNLEADIEDHKASIESLTEEIKGLQDGIKALDKAVAEATENRKEENAEYKELMASDTTAKQVLEYAKNRLNKFYNPKLYTTTAGPALSEEERINLAMGGTTTTQLAGGIAGTGIGAFVQIRAHRSSSADTDVDAPPPPPQQFGAYKKKGQESNGVIAMIDLLIADLDKEMTTAETDEKNAQEEYEQMMSDSAKKRADDAKTLEAKESAKAETEASLNQAESDLKSNTEQLMQNGKETSALHAECDWLLNHFDQRKEARASEVDALGNAKAVLSGADFSFVQTKAMRFLQRNA